MADNWQVPYFFQKHLGYFDNRSPEEAARLAKVFRQCYELAGDTVHFSAAEDGNADDLFPMFAYQEVMYDLKTEKEFISVGFFPVPGEDAFFDALVRASLSFVSKMIYFFAESPAILPVTFNNPSFTEKHLPPFVKISGVDDGPLELHCTSGIELPPGLAAQWQDLPAS